MPCHSTSTTKSGAKIEAWQWNVGQQLLALGLTVIIEWGTWARTERDTLRLGARCLAPPSSCTMSPRPRTSSSRGFNGGAGENPPIGREALSRWFEIFQAPTPEEMALFDLPLVAAPGSDPG